MGLHSADGLSYSTFVVHTFWCKLLGSDVRNGKETSLADRVQMSSPAPLLKVIVLMSEWDSRTLASTLLQDLWLSLPPTDPLSLPFSPLSEPV